MTGDGDFITNFQTAFETNNPDGKLAKLFHRYNLDDISANATNEEVVEFLRFKASSALDGVETIIIKRIKQIGINQPTIQKQLGANRIFVELPGATDKEYIRKKMQASANLEFFEVYDVAESNIAGEDNIINAIGNAEVRLSRELFGDLEGNQPKKDSTADLTADSTSIDDLTIDALEVDTADNNEDDLELNLGDLDDESTETDVAEDISAESGDTTDFELQRKLSPITAYLRPNVQQAENGQYTIVSGPVVGYCAVKDTALIMSRLTNPNCC